MTAHNHGYDPTCKETRLPDGKVVGECMSNTTNTPAPETDALSRECLNFVIDATEKDEASRISAFAVAYHRMCVHARSLETRLRTAEAELAALRSGEAALTPKEYGPDEIGGAPEGRYLMRRRVHPSDRAKAWNRYELFDRDVVAAALSKTLELPRYDRAFGPIPQPPPMKEGE